MPYWEAFSDGFLAGVTVLGALVVLVGLASVKRRP